VVQTHRDSREEGTTTPSSPSGHPDPPPVRDIRVPIGTQPNAEWKHIEDHQSDCGITVVVHHGSSGPSSLDHITIEREYGPCVFMDQLSTLTLD
jgi:hypothetical protein